MPIWCSGFGIQTKWNNCTMNSNLIKRKHVTLYELYSHQNIYVPNLILKLSICYYETAFVVNQKQVRGIYVLLLQLAIKKKEKFCKPD